MHHIAAVERTVRVAVVGKIDPQFTHQVRQLFISDPWSNRVWVVEYKCDFTRVCDALVCWCEGASGVRECRICPVDPGPSIESVGVSFGLSTCELGV